MVWLGVRVATVERGRIDRAVLCPPIPNMCALDSAHRAPLSLLTSLLLCLQLSFFTYYLLLFILYKYIELHS